MLQGNLGIKKNFRNFEFSVSISINSDILKLTSDSFVIDPLNGGVNFGSKSVFDSLDVEFINDEIQLPINQKASKAYNYQILKYRGCHWLILDQIFQSLDQIFITEFISGFFNFIRTHQLTGEQNCRHFS